jgi:hypothetical protein
MSLIVIFQLWERAAYLASHPDCTDYTICPVDLDNPLRRDSLVHFAQAILCLNTDEDKADLHRCTTAMLTWIKTHYPRPSLHSRLPTFPRTAWYDAAFYYNMTLPGAAPYTFFTVDPSIANTFKDLPHHRHYLARHLATSADGMGYFRFRDIRNITTTDPSDFQYDRAHFFPLFVLLPTLRPSQLDEALTDMCEQILFLHMRFFDLLLTKDPLATDPNPLIMDLTAPVTNPVCNPVPSLHVYNPPLPSFAHQPTFDPPSKNISTSVASDPTSA